VLNLGDLNILIVDDDVFMRGMIKQILQSCMVGDITVAEDAESGIGMAASMKPDVILCDIDMSPMSGLELLRRVRLHDDLSLRETSVIMLTGRSEKSLVAEALRLRADGYLLKPVSPNILNERLAAVAEQKWRRMSASHSGDVP
jgi:two-component system chemotaxis response regulator CheY